MKRGIRFALMFLLAYSAFAQQGPPTITLMGTDNWNLRYWHDSTGAVRLLLPYRRSRLCQIGGRAFGGGSAEDTSGFWTMSTACREWPRLTVFIEDIGAWDVEASLRFCYSEFQECSGTVYLSGIWNPKSYLQDPGSNPKPDWFGTYDWDSAHTLVCTGLLVDRETFSNPMQLQLNVVTLDGVYIGDFSDMLPARTVVSTVTQ